MNIINVSQQVLEAAEKIRRICPQAVFGGSFSLALRGIDLKRPVTDLDVLVPVFTASMLDGLCDARCDFRTYSDSCDFYGYTTVNGVKVDVGQLDSRLNPEEREGFRVNSVLGIYAAKMKYLSVTDVKNPAYKKHLEDCRVIRYWAETNLMLAGSASVYYCFDPGHEDSLSEMEYAIEIYRKVGNYGNPEL